MGVFDSWHHAQRADHPQRCAASGGEASASDLRCPRCGLHTAGTAAVAQWCPSCLFKCGIRARVKESRVVVLPAPAGRPLRLPHADRTVIPIAWHHRFEREVITREFSSLGASEPDFPAA
jgi:anaerobic selenocysteine-containing dehydrogenase